MIDLTKTQVPAYRKDDNNDGRTSWLGDTILSMRVNQNEAEVYLFHDRETLHEYEPEERDITLCYAFVVPVPYPITRSNIINNAEMKAYGLKSSLDTASFNASLARKSRLGEDLEEVEEHDNFISSVKNELDKLGW